MRRELAIALRARLTWLVAALAALFVGHGFVLAADVFSAASRSALAGTLQAREMDPLAGVVRPTLGAVDLALALFGPLLAARVLSVERERGTHGALCLQVGSTTTVYLRKALAAACATSLLLAPAIACLLAYGVAGGHVDAIETSIALGGEALHVAVIVAASIAAAAWTSSFAQAAALGIVFSRPRHAPRARRARPRAPRVRLDRSARASLPPHAVGALRAIPSPLAMTIRLDRDDSRRRQLESDVVSKLLLARPDARVVFPLDEEPRDDRYGVIELRAGDRVKETRSTSRKELVTSLLELADVPAPDWTTAPYPGYPVVIEGARRRGLLFAAYALFPGALLGIGLTLSRKRTGR